MVKNFDNFVTTLEWDKLNEFVMQGIDDTHAPMNENEKSGFAFKQMVGLIGLYHEWIHASNEHN